MLILLLYEIITLTPSRHQVHSKTEMSLVIRYNIRILTSTMIFSTLNQQKSKDIQPRPEKQINIIKKKTVYTRQRIEGTNNTYTIYCGY